MAYIVVVNPAIPLRRRNPQGGFDNRNNPCSGHRNAVMALYARRRSPSRRTWGERLYRVHRLSRYGVGWEKALGALFISGLVFVLITVLRIRSWIARDTRQPERSFAEESAFFIMFIGLNETGLIRLGMVNAPVKIGDLSGSVPAGGARNPLISILMIRRIREPFSSACW